MAVTKAILEKWMAAQKRHRLSDRHVQMARELGLNPADDISAIGLVNHLALACHQLLRLGQTDFFAALHMPHVHAGFKLSGADPHKCDPVPVRLVHICLDLKDKRRKIRLLHRVDGAGVRHPWKRGCGHL